MDEMLVFCTTAAKIAGAIFATGIFTFLSIALFAAFLVVLRDEFHEHREKKKLEK